MTGSTMTSSARTAAVVGTRTRPSLSVPAIDMTIMAGHARSGWVERPTDRRETLPPDWWRLRGHVFKRDGRRCQHIRYDTGQKCGQPATDVDHINDRDDHRPENLQSLCDWHHQQKTSSQGGNAAARNRRKAATLRHPGLL